MPELAGAGASLSSDEPSVLLYDELPAAIRLVRVRVPLRNAHRSVHGAETAREVVLVEWTRADGSAGWGECPTLENPGYATETTEQAWAGLRDDLAPAALVGSAPMLGGLLAATGALRDARLDARLRAQGRSLREELGAGPGPLRRTVVIADLGADPGELVDRAVRAIDGGAALVKLKIAPGHDLLPLTALIESVGADRVAADANGSYRDLDELRELDGLGLAYLEQPVAAGTTWDELSTLAAAMATPIALDESLTSLDSVLNAVRSGAADIISVKPARLGGAATAAAAVDLAAEHGVGAFVGGMIELGIGRATAAAVAALPGCTLPTDLGPSAQYVDLDLCEPVEVDDHGELLVPTGPGCGRTPVPERLDRFAVDEVELSR